MRKTRTASLIRPLVQSLHPYVPGEQPRTKGLVKLNTNENPYPPAPAVLALTRAAVDGRLRLYPNPTAQALREKLAAHHGCAPKNIIVGNGSDELLALAVRCFVEPAGKGIPRRRSLVQYFDPSYSLYPVLADTHGGICQPVPLEGDFSLPKNPKGKWDPDAALSFVTTPNAPSGRGYQTASLDRLCRSQRRVLVLDEAYVDFADNHAMRLALKYPNVLVGRTFSKAYSLCFQRVGYFVGHPDLIAALDKVRDSYNVNGLGQVAALATLEHLSYYRKNFAAIIRSRKKLSHDLQGRGFQVCPSQTNFILVVPPRGSAEEWQEKLRERKILVRWFKQPGISKFLRITIGTDTECETLVRAVDLILR